MSMSAKERWLAAIDFKEVDELPFWPKLGSSYQQARIGQFKEMSLEDIHTWIGSDQHIGLGGGFREIRKNTSIDIIDDGMIHKTIYHTPHGDLQQIMQRDEASNSWHPIKHPVSNLDELKLMIEFYQDVTIETDFEAIEKNRQIYKEIGEKGVTATTVGESPLMNWVEWVAGIESAHFLLFDHQQEVEELFNLMHSVLLRKTEILSEHHPADVIYFSENTSTTLISPEQYRQYCFNHISDYAEITNGNGRKLILHMCGLLKELLPDLNRLNVQAFEAFTSPTLGNTTFHDGRSICPDKCLIGGTNAMLWMKPANEIIAQIEHDLNELDHHRGIVVTSAGVMPPTCTPETIKEVCDWVREYPMR